MAIDEIIEAEQRLLRSQHHTLRERLHVVERRLHDLEMAQHHGAVRADTHGDAITEIRQAIAGIIFDMDEAAKEAAKP